ncbi:unnamed protein product [Ceutorhynchus assimilis]|uniref:Uncharacterized protein n=1 Tax=Ceutorhynchus assimilis TaxID=467358 RepID=A0A9N9MKB8_9CUCU|nr:unnamed protein product [Ceutorhynchus assimilis]
MVSRIMSMDPSLASSVNPEQFVTISRFEDLHMASKEASEWVLSTPPSRISLKTVPTSSGINFPSKTSSIRIEEKFRRYVSEGDMLLQQLTKQSDETIKLEDFCDSKHLLERNTESFRCLGQLLLSSSSLARNRLFLFPALEDPGIDTVFKYTEPSPVVDDIGAEKYKKLCTEMEIVPIKRIINSLETETVDLKYYGLTHKQIKALTDALKANAHVRNLFLEENWLSVEMTQMISDMLVENTSLQVVSLYECRIGATGK